MKESAPGPGRALALGKTVALFVAAWSAVALVLRSGQLQYLLRDGAIDAIDRVLSGFPSAAHIATWMYGNVGGDLGVTFVATLFFATLLAPLGAAARMAARSRLRGGQADFLDRLRAWTAAHPASTRALLAAPALLWVLTLDRPGHYELQHFSLWLLSTSVSFAIAGSGMYALAKKGLRALLAPTMDGAEPRSRFENGPDEIVFDAVAVTSETRGAIAALAALSLAAVVAMASRPLASLFTDSAPLYAMLGYVAVAAGTAIAFREASRVAVGIDGIHVRGTSRARFYPYRELDGARASGSELELVRGGRAVVRLQLHGDDATRRDDVIARVADSIARVKARKGAAAAQIVASSSEDALARAAAGAGDYRGATLTREQLWALVEGPEIDASARKAAAVALGRSSDDVERVRLRVAADHCAEPQVRLALLEIAGEDEAPDPVERPGLPPARG